MGKFWLILSRHLSSVVWCMSENSTLAVSLSDLYAHTRKIRTRPQPCIHTYTHPGLEERRFSSYERSQRLLSLRSDAEYLTINYSWISEALIPEPWTCQLWITYPPIQKKTPVCVYVCVHIWVSFRPYLLMEASKAPESLCIFNDVKLSFRSAVCCSKERGRWIKYKCNKLCVDTIKDQKDMAVGHGDCRDSILYITERNKVTFTLFEVAAFFFIAVVDVIFESIAHEHELNLI